MDLTNMLGDASSDLTVLQVSLRAVVVFVFATALFRCLPRKSLADTTVIDLILTLLIGSSLSRALTGNAPIGPVLAACVVLGLLWILLGLLSVRSERFSNLVKGRPLEVIRDGTLDEAVLKHAHMGRRDLEQKLRMQGYARIEDVPCAYIERNGAISVLEE